MEEEGEILDPMGLLDAVQKNLYLASLAIPGSKRWADDAKRCLDFVEGRQWDPVEYAARMEARRPALTINKIAPLFRLVYGMFLQIRQQPTFRPGNDFRSSEEVAEVMTKLVMNSNIRNGIKFVQAEVFTEALITGRGFFDVRLDFAKNAMGELALRSKNPFQVYPDPEAEEFDPRQWGFVVESRWMTVNDILVLFGGVSAAKAKEIAEGTRSEATYFDDWQWYGNAVEPASYFGLLERFERADSLSYPIQSAIEPAISLVDSSRKLVRVVDCQHKVLVPGLQWVDLETGQTTEVPDEWPREKVQAVLTWAEQRAAELGLDNTLAVRRAVVPKWRWTVTAADQLLHDDWSPYDRPTIVPNFPYFRRGVTRGMVHDLLDPQTEINKKRSAISEIISKMSAGGWWVPKNSMSPAERDYMRKFGSTPGFMAEFSGAQPPIPIVPPQLPGGYAALEQMGTADLREIANIRDANLGQAPKNVESGRGIQALQRAGDISIQPWLDSNERSLKLVGEAQRAIIQRFYTEERIFRERGEGSLDVIHVINKRMADGSIVNDVTRGAYDTVVDTAPVGSTYQEYEFEILMEMMQLGLPIPPDFIIEAAPLRRKNELLRRLGVPAAVPGMPMGGGAPGIPGAGGPPGPAAPALGPGAPPSPRGPGPAGPPNVVAMPRRPAAGGAA